ncbi:hypothetical protein [Microbispora siamensis]|uniref:Uncharacterized protein n=1 Tax=Microbispora siamensis TaxID=564413 RepID=A0ABQ4GSZ3_9ACTN|nr:hypothetical protein [Microbispora siamensis]GIH64543.1 hypothetical protein Msi02_53600 [Microbispora siamensis]
MLRLMPAPGIGKAMGRIMAKDMQAKNADVAARLIGKDDPPRESVG